MRPELRLAAEVAEAFLDSLDTRRVGPSASYDELVAALDRPLSEGGEEPEAVVADLVARSSRGSSARRRAATTAS